ncbi:transcriptional regulator [Kitasatospora sp. NPDC050543]|uniref:transcriptional regulator n=1 Tax=Kitasatospora sp. NPDC050543 TaxID=3364054 RepID=UPI00379EAE2B
MTATKEPTAQVGFRPPTLQASRAQPWVATPARYPQPPGETVERLAAGRATGVLRSEAGTVYLADGMVVQVESDHAPGLAALLTASGRITAQAWAQTVREFGPGHRVGRALIEQGRLTRGELEICHLSALYDAAFFTLGARSTLTSFEPGVRHWLGPVLPVGARRLRHEMVRRRDMLERIWPWPQVDTAPVVRTDPGQGCAAPLGARARELLDHADGRRTPADLARLLGRSAFATTAEVRRLAAAGLLVTPREAPRGSPRPSPSEAVGRTAAGLERRVRGVALAAAHPGAGPARSDAVPAPRHPSPAALPPLSVPDPDVALLTRVLTALEARL